MEWCELCQDHYDTDHYDDGNHKAGIEYGPTGRDIARNQIKAQPGCPCMTCHKLRTFDAQ